MSTDVAVDTLVDCRSPYRPIYRPGVGRVGAEWWSSIGRALADMWPTVSRYRLSVESRSIFGRYFADRSLTYHRQNTNISPTYHWESRNSTSLFVTLTPSLIFLSRNQLLFRTFPHLLSWVHECRCSLARHSILPHGLRKWTSLFCKILRNWGGGLWKILVGMCCWDSETLNLYRITFRSFLQPYSRLDAKDPYPIPDYLFSSCLSEI